MNGFVVVYWTVIFKIKTKLLKTEFIALMLGLESRFVIEVHGYHN